MKLKLIKYPATSLLDPSKTVTDFLYAAELIEAMLKFIPTLSWGIPAGLAAPQVDHNVRLFLMKTDSSLYKAFINPEIINKSKAIDFHEEGCYSLEQNKFWQVGRSSTVWVKYQDLTGDWKEEKLNGMKARIFQHELDHLEGRLCNVPN